MWTQTWRLFLLLTVITGVFYPFGMTGLAQWCFPTQANGSLMQAQGRVVGSKWIGQYFTDARYFWGRPSATAEYEYNGLASGGSNLGPSNPKLRLTIQSRIKERQWGQAPIPADLVYTSASGLDPDISPQAAYYQMERIALARHMPLEQIRALITSHIQERQAWLLGEPHINVLALNLALDAEHV